MHSFKFEFLVTGLTNSFFRSDAKLRYSVAKRNNFATKIGCVQIQFNVYVKFMRIYQVMDESSTELYPNIILLKIEKEEY